MWPIRFLKTMTTVIPAMITQVIPVIHQLDLLRIVGATSSFVAALLVVFLAFEKPPKALAIVRRYRPASLLTLVGFGACLLMYMSVFFYTHEGEAAAPWALILATATYALVCAFIAAALAYLLCLARANGDS